MAQWFDFTVWHLQNYNYCSLWRLSKWLLLATSIVILKKISHCRVLSLPIVNRNIVECMCRVRNIATKKVWLPDRRTDRQTDRHQTKLSLCAAMLCRQHKIILSWDSKSCLSFLSYLLLEVKKTWKYVSFKF